MEYVKSNIQQKPGNQEKQKQRENNRVVSIDARIQALYAENGNPLSQFVQDLKKSISKWGNYVKLINFANKDGQ